MDPLVMVFAMTETENRPSLNVEPETSAIESVFSQTTILKKPSETSTLESIYTCNIEI
jgi:hypothetical protein